MAAGAEVTRFAPSPTGVLHIGSLYTAGLDLDVARHSGGVYVVRVENTDRVRLVPDAERQFRTAFEYFGMGADESPGNGAYGPYRQSERSGIYLSYVRDLLRQGRAYPCFETGEQAAGRAARQKPTGARPGYYGEWATWRDAPEDQVRQRLEERDSYVGRFRSPGLARRVSYTDRIRGELMFDDNRNDVVILKSSHNELRLPTYHFAHAVDDHLMRITVVIRTDEWLSSVPLHHQLFDALGFGRVEYAHAAPLMKQDGGSRRSCQSATIPRPTLPITSSRASRPRPCCTPVSAGSHRTWCGQWRPVSLTGTYSRGRTSTGSTRSRSLAASLGFAPNQKTFMKNPHAYPGSIADASAIIRVLITGTRQSPDLAEICAALGREEVIRRVRAVAA